MEHRQEDFSVYHRGELRETLIMIEGDDGAFELLAHGSFPHAGREIDWASVRSSNSDAEYLLIHDARRRAEGATTSWHPATDEERALVRRAMLK